MSRSDTETALCASLPMYQRDELIASNNQYWSLIKEGLSAEGHPHPDDLDQQVVGIDAWLQSGLVFSQTCGMPYRHHLHGRVHLVGTPDFGLPDCEPGYYRSRCVVRADDPRDRIDDFSGAVLAFNNTLSQSGYAAPLVQADAQGIDWSRRVESGAHRSSAQMVRNRQADIAAIDAVTWRLIERYDNWAGELRVLASTEPTPGLPYICASRFDPVVIAGAVRNAIQSLDLDAKQSLGLQGLVTIDAGSYLDVPSPD
jgi:ABC-type phosphate/phosphonate transport system substrate-binding protein